MTVKISDFPANGNDTVRWKAALTAALKNGDRNIQFQSGEYHFYPEGCANRYCCFSNNDDGVKTIAMLLDGIDDFTISGEDAMLIFHGRISPLCAFRCKNLTIHGLTADFEDSFVSDADLIKRENGTAWFRFPGKHNVTDGKIIFTDDIYEGQNGILPFFCYDEEKKEILHNSQSIAVPNRNVKSYDGLVGVEDHFADVRTNAFLIKHEMRLCPGMVFDRCENIHISNVTIHHAAGMGILIQNSENCFLNGVVIAPRNRRASVSDDAIHVADCRGTIRIENCKLSGTLDDSINVHGVFRKLKSRIPGGKMYYLEAGHYQQQGVFNIRAGDRMELFDRKSGRPYAEIKLDKVTPINQAFVQISFDDSRLPETFVQGDPALICGTQADLEVLDTECVPLNGRGVLASGMKQIRISGCHFHSSGAGVFISGDWSFWYESGPVEDAVIENNLFDNCCYQPFASTQEPLAVFPELNELAEDYYYHGSILVRNNRFRSAVRPLVSMMSVAKADVSGNVFEPDDRYPLLPRCNTGFYFTTLDSPMAAFCHCGTVVDENNTGFRH